MSDPMTRPQPTPSAEVEALAEVVGKHIFLRGFTTIDGPQKSRCTCGHVYDNPNASEGWSHPQHVADHLAAYVQAARDEERARVLGEVHLMLDRKATEWAEEYAASDSDADYGRWDAWQNAAGFVRDARGGAR